MVAFGGWLPHQIFTRWKMNNPIRTLSSADLQLRTKRYPQKTSGISLTIEISKLNNHRTAFCSSYWNLTCQIRRNRSNRLKTGPGAEIPWDLAQSELYKEGLRAALQQASICRSLFDGRRSDESNPSSYLWRWDCSWLYSPMRGRHARPQVGQR